MEHIQSEKVKAIVQSYREKGMGELDVNSLEHHKKRIRELYELAQ